MNIEINKNKCEGCGAIDNEGGIAYDPKLKVYVCQDCDNG